MRLKQTLILLVCALTALWLLPQAVHAADVDYALDTTYSVSVDYTTKVTTRITATNTTDARSPSTLSIPTSGTQASGIKAYYEDGGQSINARFSADSQAIVLDTTRDDTGVGKQWTVVVEYTTNAAQRFGASFILSVAPYPEVLNVKQQSVTIGVDLSLGIAKPRGPAPASTNVAGGQQSLTWQSSDGPLSQAVGIIIGESAATNVTIKETLRNQTFWWRTQSITLPPDTNQQKVILESISPQPTSFSLDVDGNMLAQYRLAPRQTVTVEAKLDIVVNNYTYSLNDKSSFSDIPDDLAEKYTVNNDIWPKGDVIAEDSVLATVRKAYQANATADWRGNDQYDKSHSQANALVGTLRGVGVPSRVVLGKAFGDGGMLKTAAVSHAWVEAYVPGTGWMTLDPFFEGNGEYFGESDILHVGLVLRGLQPDFPPDQLSATTVSYTDDEIEQTPNMTPFITATNHMILPGVALRITHVDMPKGVIVDNAGLQTGQSKPSLLGSLAPLQKVVLRSLALGPAAFSSVALQYGTFNGDDALADISAQATSDTNYIPMFILIASIGLLAAGKFGYGRFKRKRTNKLPNTKSSVVYLEEDKGDDIQNSDLLGGTKNETDQPAATTESSSTESNATPSTYKTDTMPTSDDEAATPRPKPPRKPPLIQ